MRFLLIACCFLCFKAGAQSAGPAVSDDAVATQIDDSFIAPAPMGVDLMAGNSKGITVYPNPANDHIIVSLAGKMKDKREIRLVSAMGSPILQLNNLRENTYLLDVSRLQSGMYMVEVISKGNVSRTKWVKQ